MDDVRGQAKGPGLAAGLGVGDCADRQPPIRAFSESVFFQFKMALAVWGVPVQELPFLILSFALFCFVCCKGNVRSKSTILETAALVLWHFSDPTVSFFSYFTAKLFISFVAFLLSLLTTNKDKLKKLTYHIGFPSDKWHAGVSCGDTFYHYAFPRDPATAEKDQSFGLVPRDSPKHVGDKSTLKVKCGLAYHGADDSASIMKLLASCGRCHNWALITIYEMSTDKFLSLAMLSFLRWDMWVLLVGLIVGYPLAFEHDVILSFLGRLLDVLFLALSIFDSVNMSHARLLASRRHAERNPWLPLKNALKLVFLFITWYVYVEYVVKPFGVTCSFQFLLLLVLSILVTAVMNALLRG
jgi:hypothetical protein